MSAPADTPDDAIAAACRALAAGGLVACPTEAVYGLSCDPANAAAVERLLALKRRPRAKGLILIASHPDQLAGWITVPDATVRRRVEDTWPGPVTWALPAAPECPSIIRGSHETVAVRVTDHPVAATLCRRWGGPLVSTSANATGGEPARDAAGVRRLFGAAIESVIEGETGGLEQPTPIRDGCTGRILRP